MVVTRNESQFMSTTGEYTISNLIFWVGRLNPLSSPPSYCIVFSHVKLNLLIALGKSTFNIPSNLQKCQKKQKTLRKKGIFSTYDFDKINNGFWCNTLKKI